MLKSNLILRRGEELTIHLEGYEGAVTVVFPIIGNPVLKTKLPDDGEYLKVNGIPLTTENMV